MGNAKKFIFLILLGLLGFLLILAGFNLINISKELLLYSGAGLIVLAVVYYFLY